MYITDSGEQIQLIKDMTQLRKDMEKYEVFYHHPYTNQLWKSFFPWSTAEELGPKLLRHEPLPEEPSVLLSACLAEDVPQNAMGLGIELSPLPDRWPAVFDLLEANYSEYLPGQIRLFLQNLNIDRFRDSATSGNGRDTSGITEKDIKKIIWRSRKLKLKSFILR